jgi:HD-GYP domain-containing protein (c-di-GMP phosphodiesterase class II)
MRSSGANGPVSITENVKGIGIQTAPDLSPAIERLLEQAEVAPPRRLAGRQRLIEWFVAIAFAAVAVEMALALDADRALSTWVAAALVLAYAVASRIRFSDGTGYTVPTQLVFVPMLFLLPTPLVPLLVAAGTLIGNLPDYLSRRTHLDRAVLSLGDSWYTVAPALVLCLGGAQTLTPGHWPVYLAALGAQFAADFAAGVTRDWIVMGVSPQVQTRLLAWVYLVDLLLTPIGLLAALATEQVPYAFVLVLPLAALLAIFSRERSARLSQALELSRAYHGTALLLSELIEADHEYTGSHTRSVVSLSLNVADELRLDARERRNVELGALLHDVGKIAIPNEIINKPGPLDPEEWTIVKTHTLEGQRMLNRVGGVLGAVGRVVRASHERWDGNGYPDGLAGDAIPVAACVVSCCDAFNAMTTTRSYRPAMPTEAAVAELRANAGSQFSPVVVEALLRVIARNEPESTPGPLEHSIA